MAESEIAERYEVLHARAVRERAQERQGAQRLLQRRHREVTIQLGDGADVGDPGAVVRDPDPGPVVAIGGAGQADDFHRPATWRTVPIAHHVIFAQLSSPCQIGPS